jgi:hypothetical protein
VGNNPPLFIISFLLEPCPFHFFTLLLFYLFTFQPNAPVTQGLGQSPLATEAFNAELVLVRCKDNHQKSILQYPYRH